MGYTPILIVSYEDLKKNNGFAMRRFPDTSVRLGIRYWQNIKNWYPEVFDKLAKLEKGL